MSQTYNGKTVDELLTISDAAHFANFDVTKDTDEAQRAGIEAVAQVVSPQWVSVRDMLPEINAKVVVRTNNGRVFVAWITPARNWYSLDQSSEHGAKETHWTSLPPAPS